jgi:hypothetical protein
LLHKCHTESAVAALKWIVLCNRAACPKCLVRNLPQQLRHKCGVAWHKCGVTRRGVEWCGVVRNAKFRRNVQAFSAFCGLFAYTADLRHVHGVKARIRGLLNWTSENLFLPWEGFSGQRCDGQSKSHKETSSPQHRYAGLKPAIAAAILI